MTVNNFDFFGIDPTLCCVGLKVRAPFNDFLHPQLLVDDDNDNSGENQPLTFRWRKVVVK